VLILLNRTPLITQNDRGLYCAVGDFYIDPWRPVERAVITHAHADHARPGHGSYLCATAAAGVMRTRIGQHATIETLRYTESTTINGVRISLHPAGHVLGSAQVRVEHQGEVWVVSGDYKLDHDPTCQPFEPIRCHTFITESTFGLPIYRWQTHSEMFSAVNDWWRSNAEAAVASVLFCYAFGKAQRILASIDQTIGPIVCHGAVESLNKGYRAAGVALPATVLATETTNTTNLRRALVLAPPSAQGAVAAPVRRISRRVCKRLDDCARCKKTTRR
jgi:putative mRNA 3-end processing factor